MVLTRQSQTPLALAVDQKGGPSTAYIVSSVVEFVRRMTWKAVHARGDNEPIIVEVLDKAKSQLLKDHGIVFHVTFTPRYSSQSLGAIGAMQRGLHEQNRCLRTDVENAYGIKLTPNQPIWTWLVRHSARLIERLRVRGNKRTSFEDSFGIRYKEQLIPSGET